MLSRSSSIRYHNHKRGAAPGVRNNPCQMAILTRRPDRKVGCTSSRGSCEPPGQVVVAHPLGPAVGSGRTTLSSVLDWLTDFRDDESHWKRSRKASPFNLRGARVGGAICCKISKFAPSTPT